MSICKECTRSKIIAVGSYLPEKILTNFDMEKLVETSNEWILKRTGIKERHIALEQETTSDMGVNAIKNAIQNINFDINSVDMIICATTTPDLTFPSTACIIQKKLGIEKNIIAFDIQAVCSGFVYALSIADDMIKCRKIKNAIVVCSDKMSSIIDWKDRNTCVLFGDGAGAVIIQSTNEDRGIIDTELSANGNYIDILKTTNGVSTNGISGYIYMDGKAVFKHAVEKMSYSIKDIVEKNGYKLSDISIIIPHQANYRILSLVAEKLNIPYEKFMITIDKHANTCSASIPLALDIAVQQGRVKKDNLIVLEALGGGLTWGSVLLKF